MIKGHGELFKVQRETGDIELKQNLEGHNREYQLLIAAYDKGSSLYKIVHHTTVNNPFSGITPCRTDVTVHVKVIDRSMPIFEKQFYSDIVPENVELHSPLSVSVQAESPLGRKLIYSITKGNDLEEFALDFNTGKYGSLKLQTVLLWSSKCCTFPLVMALNLVSFLLITYSNDDNNE